MNWWPVIKHYFNYITGILILGSLIAFFWYLSKLDHDRPFDQCERTCKALHIEYVDLTEFACICRTADGTYKTFER